jgi:hypothetical protein
MPSTNLHGLNIIHTQPRESSTSDLSAFPDLSAQLDLWTNLAFDSDEPLIRNEENYLNVKKTSDEVDEEEDANPREGAAMHDGHVNVVTGRPFLPPADTNTNSGNNNSSASASPPIPTFDINNFLAGFGIDPYALPPQQTIPAITPSLAQLIALHAAQTAAGFHPPPPLSDVSPPPYPVQPREETPSLPPSKRPRTRKASISSTVDSGDFRDVSPNTTTPLSASEDKRRRNTAASARFRLKKKEREAALETKAKELEGRVNELERECEGLRRENGWLKGLVVGVTGAGAAQPPQSGTKRTREVSSDSTRA